MSKITGNEISPGTLINYDGGLWIAYDGGTRWVKNMATVLR